MESQPPVYHKNKPRFTIFRVNYRFTGLMSKSFGEQLRERLNDADMTAAELSRRSGVTKQGIGRILNNTPHSITGALPTVEPDTVEKLAKPLNWNLDEALLAAGYAPRNGFQASIILEGFDDLDPTDQDIAARQIKGLIEVFRTKKGVTGDEPRQEIPVLKEPAK